jgi:GTPase SAR1 family protein
LKNMDFDLDASLSEEEILSLPNEVIREIQNRVRSKDPFPIEETKTRNIIMLGRSGSGKTTAINVIKDICAKPQRRSLFSDTVGARFQSFSLDDTKAQIKYTLNIIDTPGVNEVKPMGQDARSDSSILDTVKFCLKNEITKVHALFIYVSFGERIHDLDKKAFQIYLDMFDVEDVAIAFCITKSEGRTKKECDEILNDLKSETYFSQVLDKPNVTVFFTGCVNDFMISSSTTEKTLIKYYTDVHKRREQIIKYIFDANDEGVMLFNLPIISNSMSSMNAVLDAQEDILLKLENTTDFRVGKVQNLIDQFDGNIAYMIENENLFSESGLYNRFVLIKGRMRALKDKMDNDTWVIFSSRVVI